MIGIIGAMEEEVKLLCETMVNYNTVKIGGYEFFSGKLEEPGSKKSVDAVVLRCGIGKVNAAVGCALLIQQFKPSVVINTGSAGGILPQLHVGDAVISTGLIYHDVDVTAFNYAPGQLPGHPQIFSVDEKHIKLAEDAIDELKQEKILPDNFNHSRGLIGSGDIFMHKPQLITEMRQVFPGIAAVEMEGAAIAHCCHLFAVPVLVIRALSDVAGTESPVSFKEFITIAAKHSAHITMRIVRNI